MKDVLKKILAWSLPVLALVLLCIFDRQARNKRHITTCGRLDVQILDSAKLDILTPEDIDKVIREGYGIWHGQRLDSVDLKKIETVLNDKSAVLHSEAYTTPDGVLHIEIQQRAPVVKFIRSDGRVFYSDSKGFLFPLKKNFEGDITVIEGNIPIDVEEGYKGEAKSEKEKIWVEGIIGLIRYLSAEKTFSQTFSRISVDGDRNLVFTPREGREKFIFGRPENFKSKFSRIDDYYRYIAPAKDPGYYASVDVKYAGQIICRQK